MSISIKGASEHNLQAVDVEIGDGLTVVSGVSGSGKTSLVFDTLYHEARRRFLEVFSLSPSVQRLAPADVHSITGLGPAITVGQNLLNRNPNSTLASASGLHPFLRLLFARFGERSCARCGSGLSVLTEDEIVGRLTETALNKPVHVFAPLMRGGRGSHRTLLGLLLSAFNPDEIWVDGRALPDFQSPTEPIPALDPAAPHRIEVKLDYLSGRSAALYAREVVQRGMALGAQALIVRGSGHGPGREDGWEMTLARAPVCVTCGLLFGALEPVHFNLRCPHCEGEGCQQCDQTGMYPEAAAVRWAGLRLPDLLAQPVDKVARRFEDHGLPSEAGRLQREIKRRLEALETVGLGYVSLDRPSPSLSRGEAQRVRLAVILTGELEDMLHVLDEPTIGQHPADVARLLPTLRRLPGPVVYVEHDRVAAAAADRAIDLGPGAGADGGRVLFSGAPAGLWEQDTPTGNFFSLRERVPVPDRRSAPKDFLTVRGASLRNLQQIDVAIPTGRLSVITGVSGSGKSTLVDDVLVASLKRGAAAGCQAIDGPSLKPVLVDQSPIGRNPRSNPATYTKVSDIIRDYFASVTGYSSSHFSFNRPEGACPVCKGMGAVEVKMRYLPSTWIPCSACEGRRFSDEVLDLRVDFDDRRLSIADFYRLPVRKALQLLSEEERLRLKDRTKAQGILQALVDVGLGYLSLGQPSPTLSGGEAQRVKLAKFLGRRTLSNRLLVLDEPTTGLHPQDISGLLTILDRLVRAGGTVVIVEHNLDLIRAADWVIDLGPGAGPAGGQLLYAGPPSGLAQVADSLTAQALESDATIQPREGAEKHTLKRADNIAIRNASTHNLKGVNVDIPKGRLTVVTGVSGSGKSSLVGDVLETEARRRFLESLSLYERQGTREGPEALVDSVTGLGVAITVGPEPRRQFDRRATVGTITEISHHLGVLLAWIGRRKCLKCGKQMNRVATAGFDQQWLCPSCQNIAPVAEPRHFSSSTYAAACQRCNGVGSLQVPNPEKLIIHPDKPLCGGAMYSPGFFPKGYLCKPFNHGYNFAQALAIRYDFDPATTPWEQMTVEAQQAFLYGDPEPLEVIFASRTRTSVAERIYPGFYGWIRDWDVGGTYTDSQACPQCQGARLRPEFLAVTLAGYNIHQLGEMPLEELARIVKNLFPVYANGPDGNPGQNLIQANLHTVSRRLRFLGQVGLGYLHLNRITTTLSAGESQRIKLAGLLGSGLTSLTVLLDEPTRGLHPAEVDALRDVLFELRDEGNTVVLVEHDLELIRAADYLLDLGPGAGRAGGEIVAQGRPEELVKSNTPTAGWLRGDRPFDLRVKRGQADAWLAIRGARANNLKNLDLALPLGVLVGVCGVSGSGKSTLLIDTLGRALAPMKHTTSVAQEPLDPGDHDVIEGAPGRTILVDQSKAGVVSPAAFLGLNGPFKKLYATSEDAQLLGLDEKSLARSCSSCNGRGAIKMDMGFLPAIRTTCETCRGTGYLAEAGEVTLQGITLPELDALTIDEVYDLFGDQPEVSRKLAAAREVGLGYLVLRQPGYALSGGEAQRLKIAKELCRKTPSSTLYILDEPTVGQHLEDVMRLIGVLLKLVEAGHSVIVVEHHVHLLAACDWLVEFGPGGGPEGGHIIAAGTPEVVAGGSTPTAPYLKQLLEEGRA